MATIPKTLENENFRFIKLRTKEKIPLEQGWTTNKNYRYDSPELQLHLKHGGNYGVCGGFGNLVIIDCDIPEVSQAVEALLPETFTVKSGRTKNPGKHFYYLC